MRIKAFMIVSLGLHLVTIVMLLSAVDALNGVQARIENAVQASTEKVLARMDSLSAEVRKPPWWR